MTIVVKRIPQLPSGANAQPGWKIAIWDDSTNTTKQVDVSEFLNNESSGDYDWISTTTYAVNEVVFYNNKLWASSINGNIGNVPQAGPNWVEVVQGQSGGLKSWIASAYTSDEVFVVYDDGAGNQIYELVAVARPYNSSDIAAEILAGDWEPFNSTVSDVPFDGNRIIKRVPVLGDNYGTTSTNDFIEAAFFPSLIASITQSSYALKEVGVSFAPTVIGTINPQDSIIVARRIREVIGNTIVANPAGNAVNELLSAITMVDGINKTYRIEADVTTDGNATTEQSPDRNLEAVYPYFSGFGAAGLIENPLYLALTKFVAKQGNYAFNLVGTNQKMYIAFDANLPNLTSIKDPNGFEILGSVFSNTPVVANVIASGLANNWTKLYKIYESVSNTTANGNHTITH